MIDHTRDREAPEAAADVQVLLSEALGAVGKLGAATAAATVKTRMAENAIDEMAAWDPPPPWNPNPGIGGRVSLSEAVGQALGTASMAWTPRPEGIFDSREAVRVFDGIMAWLSDWMYEQVKEANAATAAKLVGQVKAHRDQYAKPGGVWSALEDLRLNLEGE